MERRYIRRPKVTTLETEHLKLVSLQPVSVNGWVVKVSSNQDGNILVVMYHPDFMETMIDYFTNEVEANEYVYMFLQKYS